MTKDQTYHVTSVVAVNPNATVSVLGVGAALCPKVDASFLATAGNAAPRRGSYRHYEHGLVSCHEKILTHTNDSKN